MTTLVVVWAAVAIGFTFVYLRRSEGRSGLVLAYITLLFVNYWLGSAVYVLRDFAPTRDPELTRLGFQQSLYGLIAFVVGSLVALALAPRPPAGEPTEARHGHESGSSTIARWYLVVGALSYAALMTALKSVPSATSLAAVGQQLFVVGVCLLARNAWLAGNRARFLCLLASACILPLFTIVSAGFIGYGAVAMVAVMSFAGTFARPKAAVVAGGALLAFMSLSLFVTYSRDRPEIREVVWGGAPANARVDRLAETLSSFEFFSPHNGRHLDAIDDRLNLSYLTGVAIRRMEVTHSYANGATLRQAATALVPRVLLPDKATAGGSALVTKFTGIRFYGTTSVGMGQVMELYINMGTGAVILGFFLIGVVMTLLDHRGQNRLARGDEAGFATTFVIGLSLLQVGGALAEVVATAGASIVLMLVLNRSFIRSPSHRPVLSGASPPVPVA